ncbi:MAG: EFR1 family ferrodoxin, partial [Eubacteriales bacterium]
EKMEVYYFTGTGNSFAVARDLAEKMDAKCIPIAQFQAMDNIETEQSIGIVFPLYDFKAPKMIEQFLSKIKDLNTKYIFAVSTYGITPLKAMKSFDTLITSHGGKLAAGYTVKMPHNGIGSRLFSDKDHNRLFENCKVKMNMISEQVLAGMEVKPETSNVFFGFVMSGVLLRMIPTMFQLMRQVVLKGWKSLALKANENCVGCGICSKICPVNNIELIEEKPAWGDHCTGCLGCFHWCPNNAIQFGQIKLNVRKYHHPDVKISDMSLR